MSDLQFVNQIKHTKMSTRNALSGKLRKYLNEIFQKQNSLVSFVNAVMVVLRNFEFQAIIIFDQFFAHLRIFIFFSRFVVRSRHFIW